MGCQPRRASFGGWYDRNDLSLCGFDPAHYLHAGGVAIREFHLKRRDPIIAELHRIRESIGKAHDFDVYRIAATIRRHEDEGRKATVRELPKRTTRQKKAS